MPQRRPSLLTTVAGTGGFVRLIAGTTEALGGHVTLARGERASLVGFTSEVR